MKPRTPSALYCDHANESPRHAPCQCPADCYCKREGNCGKRVRKPTRPTDRQRLKRIARIIASLPCYRAAFFGTPQEPGERRYILREDKYLELCSLVLPAAMKAEKERMK